MQELLTFHCPPHGHPYLVQPKQQRKQQIPGNYDADIAETIICDFFNLIAT
jgi:hypothetical protein